MIKSIARDDLLSFMNGTIVNIENGDIRNRYTIRDAARPGATTRSSRRAKPLGSGGTGVVFLADQALHERIRVRRAIKFFVFRDDIATMAAHQKEAPLSASHFGDELQNLSGFQHENIVKVNAAGFWHAREHRLWVPAVVTELIDGPTLKDLMERKALERWVSDWPGIVVDILLQLCAGVAHLHSRQFYHCDLAPKNIFIQGKPPNVRLIIGDLGAGRAVPLRRRNRIWLIGTKKYAPLRVAKQFDTWISAEQFEALQPEWDLYALSMIMLEVIDSLDKDAERLRSWQGSLRRLLNDLFRGGAFLSENVSSAQELYERVEWLHPRERTLAKIPELAENYPGRRLILMPVESVAVSERIRQLTDHPALQRLKLVPQLTRADAVFPAATHSRYEHSLGTYEVVRRYLIALLHDDEFLRGFFADDGELALLAGILSSVTRFPFSSVVHEVKAKAKGTNVFSSVSRLTLLDRIFSHGSRLTSLAHVIKAQFPKVELDRLRAVLSGRPLATDHGATSVHNLLNSSLDARVLDYLRRDSLHLGVSRGDWLDMNEFLRHIRLREDRLVVSSRALPAVEQIIAYRYWMFRRIYWNSPNRAVSAMIRHVLVSLSEKHQSFEQQFLNKALTLSEGDLWLFVRQFCHRHRETALSEVWELVGKDRLSWFQEIGDFNRAEGNARSVSICDRVSSLSLDELTLLQDRINESVRRKFSRRLRRDSVHLLLDMPVEEATKKFGEDVNVVTYAGDLVPLARLSGLVDGVQRGSTQQLERLRVFMNPLSLDRVRRAPAESSTEHDLMEIVQAELEAAT